MDIFCSLLGCVETESHKLLEAARTGDVEGVRAALQKKPRAAWLAQQWGGQTAWHLAAKEGHTDVLVAMGEGVRAADQAALQGPDVGRNTTRDELLQRAVQQPDVKGLTPLHMACIKGHAESAKVLMELGSNPYVMDSVGRTPLHYAASWGFADCINSVLGHHSGPPKQGWELAWPNTSDTRLVDVRNAAGFSPLHYAVWVGRKNAIQALASYDADLKVTNIANDYEWIKVGVGNTPLHLAAFGGDHDVVKLLLMGYVQSLAAGAEVMSAAHGQWGERHIDDVRHMRNRRGWMAYHIAMHKGFQHLAEMLHPDIPYTFIFSNDDMEPGNVRMFGPARLMVIAAKALQQKLVDELGCVEQEVEQEEEEEEGQGAVAKPAAAQDAAAAVPAAAAAAASASASGGGAAADAGGEAPLAGASSGGGAAPAPGVSPFAAKSLWGWTQSFSATPSPGVTPSSSIPGPAGTAGTAAAAAPPTAAGAAAPFPTTSGASSLSGPGAAVAGGAAAAAAGGAAGAAAAAAAAGSPPPPVETECSFGAATAPQSRLAPLSTAPPGLLAGGDSFGGFTVGGGQAGAGEIDASAGDASSSGQRLPPSSLLSATGQPVAGPPPGAAAAAGSGEPGTSPGSSQRQSKQGGGPHHHHLRGRHHRRVQSAVTARGFEANGRAGEDEASAQRQAWRRMDSTKRLDSHKGALGDEMLPPSAVQLSADDQVDDTRGSKGASSAAGTSATTRDPSEQHLAAAGWRGSLPASLGAGGASTAADSADGGGGGIPVVRRISSTPSRPMTAPGASAGGGGPPAADAVDTVSDNPLNVVLAARASQIGQDPEAIRQQLLAMKLASGMLQFNTAVTALNATLAGTEAGARLASFAGPPSRNARASFTNRAAPGATPDASPTAAAAAAAAAAEMGAQFAPPAPAAGGVDGGQHQQTQPAAGAARGLVSSPSLYNSAAVNVMTKQPSASLQRLLSGTPPRMRRGPSCALQGSGGGLGSSVGGSLGATGEGSVGNAGAAALDAAGRAGGAHGAAAGNGELPMIQQQGGAHAAMIAEEGADGGDDDDGGECEICFDAQAVVALQRCGHTLCVRCCRELTKLHHFKPGLCPYCRQIICGFSRATCVFIP